MKTVKSFLNSMEQKEILILDIETTDLSPKVGSIVEIGIVSLNLETGDISVLMDSVVKEPRLTAKDREAWIFKNSDLTVEEVRNAPLLSDLFNEIQEILNKYKLGVTAFNKAFDFRYLKDRGFVIKKELPCPMLLSTDICKLPKNSYGGYKWPKVEEAWQYFFPDVPYLEKHRGADDAKHEAMIVYKLYELGIFKV